jgi:hypothetical protein
LVKVIALSEETVVGHHKGGNNAIRLLVEEQQDVAREEPLVIATMRQEEAVRLLNCFPCGTKEVDRDAAAPRDKLWGRGHGVILIWIGKEVVMDFESLLGAVTPGILGDSGQGVGMGVREALLADVAARKEIVDRVVGLDVRTDIIVNNVGEEQIALRRKGRC